MLVRSLSQVALPILIIALGAGGLMWLSTQDAPPDRVVRELPAPLMETVALGNDVSRFQIQVSGHVMPRREVTLSAEVAGSVVFKGEFVESGRHVRQGTPLLRIDPALFELQVSELDSAMDQVAVDLQKLVIEEKGVDALIKLAEREAELADKALKRHQSLALKKAVSESELETVERAELQARNILRVLLNRRDLIPIRRERLQAESKLTLLKQKQAQLQLDHTKIMAPFSGILTAVMVEQSDYVEAGDELLELVDTSTVDVECSLRMDDLYWLWNSNTLSDAPSDGKSRRSTKIAPVSSNRDASELPLAESPSNNETATNDADLGEVFEVPRVRAKVSGEVAGRVFHWNGTLARYGGRGVNRKTRTVLCRVTVDKPVRTDAGDGPPTLMRGMYVTVTLDVEPSIRLWHIPTRAVQPDGQVWTVNDGVLRGHKVRPAKTLSDGVLVRTDSTDLKPGDRVVITQLVTPIEGSPVREIAKDRGPAQATVSGGGSSR